VLSIAVECRFVSRSVRYRELSAAYSIDYCLYCQRISQDIQFSKATVTGFEIIVCVCVNEQGVRSNSSRHHFLLIHIIPFSPYVSLSFGKSLVHNSLIP